MDAAALPVLACAPPVPPPSRPPVPQPAVSVAEETSAAEGEVDAALAALQSEFESAVAQFDALSCTVDPEEEPYKSKYAARELLVRREVLGPPAVAMVGVVLQTKACDGLRARLADASSPPPPHIAEAIGTWLITADRRIGVNYILTEENQPGFVLLTSVTKRLLPLVLPPPAVSTLPALRRYLLLAADLLYSCNFQCLLLSGWAKHNSCARRLRIAKAAYSGALHATRTLLGLGDSPSLRLSPSFPSLSIFLLPEDVPPLIQGPLEAVHALFTHTLFYCAQSFGNLGRPDKSARYVEATLQRQLDLCAGTVKLPPAAEVRNEYEQLTDINCLEWAKNAVRLSEYYVGNCEWVAAAHCLTAADVMIKRVAAADTDAVDQEPYKRIVAECSGQWGALYAAILRLAYECFRAKALGHPPPPTTPHVPERLTRAKLAASRKAAGGETDNADASQSSMDEEGEAHTHTHTPRPHPPPFQSLILAATGRAVLVVDGVERVRDFESARAVFKKGMAQFNIALQTLVLDGYVSDHCDFLTMAAKLYKYLAVWETDTKRCIAMHQRRIDMLSPLLEALNPNVYIVILKETSLDVSQAANEIVEMRYAKLAAYSGGPKPAASEFDKLNADITRAMHLFAYFTRCYTDKRIPAPLAVVAKYRPDIATAPLPGATYLDDGSMEAYLSALFAIGRLFGKDIRRSPEERLNAMKASLEQFQCVKAVAAAIIPPGDPMFVQELRAADEFIALLPTKINNFHFKGIA